MSRVVSQFIDLSGARGSLTLSGEDLIHFSLSGIPNDPTADASETFSPSGYLSTKISLSDFIFALESYLTTVAPHGILELGSSSLVSNDEYIRLSIVDPISGTVDKYIPVYDKV